MTKIRFMPFVLLFIAHLILLAFFLRGSDESAEFLQFKTIVLSIVIPSTFLTLLMARKGLAFHMTEQGLTRVILGGRIEIKWDEITTVEKKTFFYVMKRPEKNSVILFPSALLLINPEEVFQSINEKAPENHPIREVIKEQTL